MSFFSLQNAVCFIILTYLVSVLFTFYIQGVLKFKKNNSSAKKLKHSVQLRRYILCGDVAACHRAECVLCARHTTHTPLYLLVCELRRF